MGNSTHRLNQLVLVCEGRRCRPGRHIELVEDVADVPVDRFFAQRQFSGDAFVRLARSQQAQNLQFACGQTVRRLVRFGSNKGVDPRQVRRSAETFEREHVIMGLANANSPMSWDFNMLGSARAYAEALVRKSDVPLPTIDPGIAKVIQSKFAYGIALDSSRRAVIPENFFNGQRQDWFPALYELKLTQVS